MSSSIDLHFPQLTGLIEQWWRGVHPEGVPPHVTLLYPWRHPVTAADLRSVSIVAARQQPFTVTFTHLASFPSGVVYLLPQPQDTLCWLIAHLAESFPDTPPYGGMLAEPIPHLTVARTTPGPGLHDLADQIREILRPELPIDIDIDRVTVMEERPDETWHSVADLPFGHERDPPPHS